MSDIDATLRAAFRSWFGLPPAEADLLVALYVAKGEPVHPSDLVKAAEIAPMSFYTRMSCLRQAFEPEAIDNIPRAGYSLTEVGLAECKSALSQMAGELAVALAEAA